MSALVIVNAASAGGKTGAIWPRAEATLRAGGLDFDAVFTAGPGDAQTLAATALDDGRRLIVGCGGDGTLSEIVNGMIDETGNPRAAGAVLGVVPSGTGGDFRRTVGIPGDPEKAAAIVVAGHTRTLDAGLIEYASGESRRFVNIASCGLGGDVDRRVNGLRVKPGKVVYGLVSMYSALAYKPVVATVRVDGAELHGAFMSVTLANGRYFGGAMMIAPHAEPDDGLLDVILTSTTRARLIAGARHVYSGRHLELPGSLALRGVEIEILPDDGAHMGFDVDGEAVGAAPAKVRALPRALELCCPA